MDRKESDAFELPPLVGTGNTSHQPSNIPITHKMDTHDTLLPNIEVSSKIHRVRMHDHHDSSSLTSSISTSTSASISSSREVSVPRTTDNSPKGNTTLHSVREFTRNLLPFIPSGAITDIKPRTPVGSEKLHVKPIYEKSYDNFVDQFHQQMHSVSMKLKGKLNDVEDILQMHEVTSLESGSRKKLPHFKPTNSHDTHFHGKSVFAPEYTQETIVDLDENTSTCMVDKANLQLEKSQHFISSMQLGLSP